jgi:two-component system, OmpR family, sensor histidine kinase SenX3
MRVRSVAAGLVVPVLLVGLVVLLATMQYRWLGQVSEAERAQLQRSLSERARDFADDFDGEITRLYLALRSHADQAAGRGPAAVPAALDAWRASTRFPQIVRAVYLAESAGDGFTLRLYDPAARRFSTAPEAWPANLAPVRGRLGGSHQAVARTSGPVPGQVFAISAPPLLPEIPAVIIPVAAPLAGVVLTNPRVELQTRSEAATVISQRREPVVKGGAGGDAFVKGAVSWLPALQSYLVVELDADVLRKVLVPALVSRHFPENDSTPYRVAIRTEGGTIIFSRGVAEGSALDAKHADASASFFRLRPEVIRDVFAPAVTVTGIAPSGATPADAAGVPVVPKPGAEPRQFSIFVQQWSVNGRPPAADGRVALRQTVMTDSAWQVVLQHAAGSLDVAVARARRRNLALSFGILSVLAAGVMLVVVNARRTKQLAARQMNFVATVTHELRTPLAVIRSAAQNLSAGVVAEPAQSRTYGELIDKEGRRLTDMVEQVLAYAGLEGGKAPRMTQRVDLSHLVNDVLDACQPLCSEAGITVEFDTDAAAGAPPVTGDEAGLRLVVQNLVANALKHGAEGRWIGVSVSGGTHHGRPEARVTVSDRGRGIDPSELAHVFDPFYRGRRALDDQIRGNGLGLSLVKRIIGAHGGRVAVEAAPCAGAAFTISLPAAAEEPRA